ncbi:ParA family protein [Cohnella fermenti]|uniref:ParA family protein n=1 Tax=Cohnella fermenti TaxID=2565925 RepID=UPI002ED8A0C7
MSGGSYTFRSSSASADGKKVLLVDADAQGNLTDSLGFHEPDSLSVLVTVLVKNYFRL